MYCSKCGAESPSVSNYCSECGSALAVSITKNDPSQPLNPEKPKAKTRVKPNLWNPTAAANWSLLFSPAFGAYIHMLNWQALGYSEKAKNSRNWFLIGLLLSLFGLGLIVLIAWYFASAKEQIKYVKTHFGDNYPKNSLGKPLLIALGISLIVITLVFLIPDSNKHMEKQNIQSPQSNPFDQFDDITKSNQQESRADLATDRSAWLRRVDEIQNKINNNQIPLIESVIINKHVEHLSNELGSMLESNQTWWKSLHGDQRIIYIHFSNKSEFPIHGLVLNSFQNLCGESSNKHEFIIESNRTIEPFSEVVLSFLAPEYLNSPNDQCLNIISTWW